MRPWVDMVAALLLVCSGILSALDSFLEANYEMATLPIGLALLLINHGSRQPLRYLYLILLLVLLRIILKGDERFLPAEITLGDYIMIILGFAASYHLPQSFWRVFLPLFAIFVPLASLLSYQIRPLSEAMEPFNAGTLSINQTSFLLGSCLVLSLCFLWNSATSQRPAQLRSLLTICWMMITLIIIFLEVRTASRAGQAIPLLTFAVMLALAHWHNIRQQLQRILGSIASFLQPLAPKTAQRVVNIGFLAGGIGLLITLLGTWARKVYSDPENSLSDLHRVHLLRCYFGTLFTGNNRLIHGMGFTNASHTICKDIGLIKGTTHAHNIFAQIASDNGLFAMIAVGCFTAWFLLQALRNSKKIDHPIIFGSSCLFLYLFLFLQIEGGWGKSIFLQTLIGLSLGTLTMQSSGLRNQTFRSRFQ